MEWGTELDGFASMTVAEVLAGHGILTVGELFSRRPASFEHLQVRGAGHALSAGRAAVGGRLRNRWTVFRRFDGGAVRAEHWCVLMGAGALAVRWAEGQDVQSASERIVVVGYTASSEDGTPFLDQAERVHSSGSQVALPCYGLDGVDDRVLRGLMQRARGMMGTPLKVRDPVPPETLKRHQLPARGAALLGVHQDRPLDRRRMAFDEALVVQLTGMLHLGREARGQTHTLLHGFAGQVGQTLELSLSDAQQACLEDIKRDLRGTSPMRRLLTGEVGAGKGAVAMMAAAMVAEGRSQVLFLADDAAGAATRFLHTEPVLREGGLLSMLVPSPPTGSQRPVRRGEVHAVFGSLDLLEHDLEFRRLGLVIAVERDRWGRAGLLHRQLPHPRPDLLLVNSVPVGARLMLTAYADHEVSVLVDEHRQAASIQLFKAEARAMLMRGCGKAWRRVGRRSCSFR